MVKNRAPTGKYVLTGAPNCGKTTVIDYLSSRGHVTLPESARIILNRKRIDGDKFGDFVEKEIYTLQREMEEVAIRLSNNKLFLDRSLIDCYAYSQIQNGVIPKSFESDKIKGRYDLVFLLDRLPFKKDEIRVESGDEEAQKVHDTLRETYTNFGYNPVRVPLFNGNSIDECIAKRANFILEEVEKYEKQTRN